MWQVLPVLNSQTHRRIRDLGCSLNLFYPKTESLTSTATGYRHLFNLFLKKNPTNKPKNNTQKTQQSKPPTPLPKTEIPHVAQTTHLSLLLALNAIFLGFLAIKTIFSYSIYCAFKVEVNFLPFTVLCPSRSLPHHLQTILSSD